MPTKQATTTTRLSRVLPYILIVAGAIALICSYIIMQDKLHLLANPNYRPNCDLNPVVSCGSVMASPEGSAFGFPNPIIGLAAYPALITIGVAMLAGAKFKNWFWRGLNAGLLVAVVFIHWLFVESVYRIHALCPYCIIVWVMTITTLWYVTVYCLREGYLPTPARLSGIVRFIQRYHLEILICWFLIILALILQHFWYYYGKYL